MVKKTSSKLKGLLKKANAKWKKTEAASGGFNNDNVEDGSYDAALTGAELKELGGKGCVVLSYTIADGGDCEGEVMTARYFLESDQNLAFFKRDLGKFVDDVDEVDLENDLEETLETILEGEPACRITVRTKDEYQNVYLNKVEIDGDGDDEEDEDEDKPARGGKKNGKKGNKKPKPEEDDEEEDDEEEDGEEVDIDVGSKVTVNFKGKEHSGKVTELDEDEEKVQVKFKVDGKFKEQWFKADKVEAA